MKQVVLSARGCTGRGVRLRTLSPTQRSLIIESAAKDLGTDGTMPEFRAREAMMSVNTMVLAISEQAGLKSKADLIALGDKVVWKKVTVEEMAENAAKYFNAKDISALIGIFRSLHDVSDKEVDDILGEALDVTED